MGWHGQEGLHEDQAARMKKGRLARSSAEAAELSDTYQVSEGKGSQKAMFGDWASLVHSRGHHINTHCYLLTRCLSVAASMPTGELLIHSIQAAPVVYGHFWITT